MSGSLLLAELSQAESHVSVNQQRLRISLA